MNSHDLEALLGNGAYLRCLASVLQDERPYSYTYLEQDEYLKLADIPSQAKVYWFEIVERAHCAAHLALLRAHSWWSGMVGAASQPSYVAFAACFRGLLESAADTQYALGDVPDALVYYFDPIKRSLDGGLRVMVLAKHLEDSLIHFSHARRLSKGETAPDSHQAKQMKAYLDAMEGAERGPLHDCYASLCNITHPAAESVLYHLAPQHDGSIRFSADADHEAIVDLCDAGRSIICYSLASTLTYGLTILKIINRLKIEGLTSPRVETISLDEIPLWVRLKDQLPEPRP